MNKTTLLLALVASFSPAFAEEAKPATPAPATPAAPAEAPTTYVVKVSGPMCGSCVKSVVAALKKAPGAKDCAAPTSGYESYEVTVAPGKTLDAAAATEALKKSPKFKVTSVEKKECAPEPKKT